MRWVDDPYSARSRAAVESGNRSAFQLEVEVDDAWDGAVLTKRKEPVIDAEVMKPRSLRIVS